MKELLEKTNKKTLILIGGFLILICIIIFGGALLYNKLFYKTSYPEIENIMRNATIEYLSDRKDKLPQNINESISITEETLVSTENMKSINELIKNNDISCDGKVIVTNINGNYRYNPIINCEGEYETIKFVDYINKNINITETENGLHKSGNDLIFKGDNVNNYLQFSNKMYRIVKITNDYTVLILTEKLDNIAWDNRYNIDKDSKTGINNYTVSRIKDYLTALYKGNTLISKEDKLLVASHNVPIGKRNTNESDKSGSIENTTILEDQYISLLPAYDFLNASLDKNCTTTIAESCSNYNYLAQYNLNWWTATANNKNTHQVYRINGSIKLTQASNTAYVRPVIYLNKDAIYVSGNGTKENPYKVK